MLSYVESGIDQRIGRPLGRIRPRYASNSQPARYIAKPTRARAPLSTLSQCPSVANLWILWSSGRVKKEASQDELTVLKDAKLKPARQPHGITPDQATKLVYGNIKKLCSDGPGDGYKLRSIKGEDLVYAIFNDIDRVLFGGVLHGNVFLQITDKLPYYIHGAIFRPGKDNCSRIKIDLSRAAMGQPADEMQRQEAYRPTHLIQVLVHEMIHAFLLQCCGYRDYDAEGIGHDLGHSVHFSVIAAMFYHALLGTDCLYPALLGIPYPGKDTYPLNRMPYLEPRLWARGGARSTVCYKKTSSQYPDDKGQSCCNGWDLGSSMIQCEHNIKQITTVAAPKLDLESKCPKDSGGTLRPINHFVHSIVDGETQATLRSVYKTVNPHYIEVIYRDRAYAIPKGSLRNKALGDMKSGSSITITIPDDIAFHMFYGYLTQGDYRSGNARFIKDSHYMYQGNEVISHIRVYRIASSINDDELKELAIGYLHSDIRSCTNPIPAISYAYHGPELRDDNDKKALNKESYKPPDYLRTLIKDYLSMVHKEIACWDGYGEALRPIHILDWLEDSQLTEQWSACKQKGGLLVADVDEVRARIKARLGNPMMMGDARTPIMDTRATPSYQHLKSLPNHFKGFLGQVGSPRLIEGRYGRFDDSPYETTVPANCEW